LTLAALRANEPALRSDAVRQFRHLGVTARRLPPRVVRRLQLLALLHSAETNGKVPGMLVAGLATPAGESLLDRYLAATPKTLMRLSFPELVSPKLMGIARRQAADLRAIAERLRAVTRS
jgi:hypothetical protein